MSIPEPVTRLRDALQKLYGQRLEAVVLYGSYARGSQTQDSDVDVAIVLKGDISPTREIDRMAGIVSDLNLEYSTLLSVYPVSAADYQSRRSPLLINVRREGIAA